MQVLPYNPALLLFLKNARADVESRVRSVCSGGTDGAFINRQNIAYETRQPKQIRSTDGKDTYVKNEMYGVKSKLEVFC